MAEWVIGVGQLNEYVRRQLAADPMLKLVRVRGEISGFKRHYSGHLYFSLKDEEARVQCVMFRQNAVTLGFNPRDGMRVIVTANASLFARDGAFQLYCEAIQDDGKGELYLRFEQLKIKLEAEGLFDPSIKQELPMLPRVIGIVTSKAGAALQDIIRVSRRRDQNISILIASCSVQGEGAAVEIAQAIEALNENGTPDVILCGRGGGSVEDLWAFNEEVVARAIYNSRIPIISCVGHETDFTISDFVADVRAATPSMAAELAVPVKAELRIMLENIRMDMMRAQTQALALFRARLNQISMSPVLRFPAQMLLASRKEQLLTLRSRLMLTFERRIVGEKNQLALLKRTLSGLNPASVMERGYAVVEGSAGIITSISMLTPGDTVCIRMKTGKADARLLRVDMEEKDAET